MFHPQNTFFVRMSPSGKVSPVAVHPSPAPLVTPLSLTSVYRMYNSLFSLQSGEGQVTRSSSMCDIRCYDSRTNERRNFEYGWLPAYHYSTTSKNASIVQRDVWGSKNSHGTSLGDRSFITAEPCLWNKLGYLPTNTFLNLSFWSFTDGFWRRTCFAEGYSVYSDFCF